MHFYWLWGKMLGVMWTWEQWKHFIETSVAFSHDALHVLVGVLVLLAAALVLRRPISSWRPWLVVLLLIFLNEFADLTFNRWPHPAVVRGESMRDFLLTMFLPTVLMFTVRWSPRLFAPGR